MAERRFTRGPDLTAPAPRPRRMVARVLVLGAALALVGSACGIGATPAPAAVTVGSNYSDEVPKAAFEAMLEYCAGEKDVDPTINTTEHGKFQDSINAYLQATPDDVFTWFAGYRMRFFAGQGLATDISDVWTTVGGPTADPVTAYAAAAAATDSEAAKGGAALPSSTDSTSSGATIDGAGPLPIHSALRSTRSRLLLASRTFCAYSLASMPRGKSTR